MPKVLLIQPTQYLKNKKPCRKSRINMPELSLVMLAAVTPPNWKVDIKMEVIEDIDFDVEYDLIGIGAMGHAVYRAIDIAREFKKRGKIVFMGGYMVSIFPEMIRDIADGIIIGDGEISYPELLKDFEKNGTIKKIYHHPLQDLKGLPVPAYEYFLNKNTGFMLPVQSGRGCPNTCSFCSIYCIYKGRHLTRPVDEVIRDIVKIKELGYKGFFLVDDNLFSNPEFLTDFLQKIIPLKMIWVGQSTINIAEQDFILHLLVKSGCKMLNIGIESISQEGVDRLHKSWMKTGETGSLLRKIRKAGIMTATEIMIGTDGDTEKSLKETAEFVVKNKITLPIFLVLTPSPGTELFLKYKKENKLIHEDLSKYTTYECVHYPEKISPQRVNEMYVWLYRTVFSIKNIVKRTIFVKNILKTPFLYLVAFFVNLRYRRNAANDEISIIF